jgi:hypothetical protein
MAQIYTRRFILPNGLGAKQFVLVVLEMSKLEPYWIYYLFP